MLQPNLELANQILGFFLDLDVAIADQAENAARLDLAVREEMVEEERRHALKADKPAFGALAPAGCGGQLPEARDLRWDRHQGVHQASI